MFSTEDDWNSCQHDGHVDSSDDIEYKRHHGVNGRHVHIVHSAVRVDVAAVIGTVDYRRRHYHQRMQVKRLADAGIFTRRACLLISVPDCNRVASTVDVHLEVPCVESIRIKIYVRYVDLFLPELEMRDRDGTKAPPKKERDCRERCCPHPCAGLYRYVYQRNSPESPESKILHSNTTRTAGSIEPSSFVKGPSRARFC